MRADADRSHRACVEAFGVSWDEIEQCTGSDFATNQQLDYEKITGELSLSANLKCFIKSHLSILAPVIAQFNWVPTIVYNGQISEISHTGRAPPLKEILCDFIHNTNPACAARKR